MLIIQLLLESISSKDDCQVINSFMGLISRRSAAQEKFVKHLIRLTI
jgi:hypothetical protein